MKFSLNLLVAIAFTLSASTAMAERINVSSNVNVEQSVNRMVEAVKSAGARVFVTIDFQRGAATQGETLRPTQIVIFGSPKIGSTALQAGQTMGLFLPLKVLFYEDEGGQTWATYDNPSAVAPTHGIAADNPAVLRMRAALERFVGIATRG